MSGKAESPTTPLSDSEFLDTETGTPKPLETPLTEREERYSERIRRERIRDMENLQAELRQALDRISELENARDNPATPEEPKGSLFPAGPHKPPIFSGGYNPTASEYFTRFEEISMAHSWKDDRRAEVLSLFLDGEALQEYRKLDAATRKNYKNTRDALIAVLQPVESERFYYQLLHGPNARRQLEGETVGNYAADIEKLVNGAYPVTQAFPKASQEKIMCDLFIANLRPEIRKEVVNKEPNSFPKALEEARKYEARTFLLSGLNPASKTTVDIAGTKAAQVFEVNTETRNSRPYQQFQPRGNFRGNFRQRGNFRGNSRPFCRYCKRPGHVIEECYAKRNNESQRDQGQYNQGRFSFQNGMRENTRGSNFRTMQQGRPFRGRGYGTFRGRGGRRGFSHRVNATEYQGTNEHRNEYVANEYENVEKYANETEQTRQSTIRIHPTVEANPGESQYKIDTLDTYEHEPQVFIPCPIELSYCKHNYSQWNQLADKCKIAVRCPQGHNVQTDLGCFTNCVVYNCSSGIICALCQHNEYCAECEYQKEHSVVRKHKESKRKLRKHTDSMAQKNQETISVTEKVSKLENKDCSHERKELKLKRSLSEPNVHKPQKRVTKWKSLPYLLFSTALLLSYANFGNAMELDKYAETQFFYKCGRSRSGHPIGIPKKVECNPPNKMSESQMKQANVRIWVPRDTPSVTEAAKCFIKKVKVCTYESFLFSKSILSQETTVIQVPLDICLTAWHYKLYREHKLTQFSPGVWVTNRTVDVKFKYCCYEVCNSVENFILEIGEIATMDGERLSTDLGDVSTCRADNMASCLVQGYRYVWDQKRLVTFCPLVEKGIFNATIWNDHVIIDQLQAAFSKIHEEIKGTMAHLNCVPRGFMTNQGVAIEIVRVSSHATAEINARFRRDTEDKKGTIETSDPVNAKLEYLAQKLIQNEKRDFHDLWLQLCHVAQRQLTLIWQILRIDPTLGARAFLDRFDIHADWQGESLSIWKCHQVIPQQIYWDYQVNGTCYDSIPVLVSNEILFIIPGTQDLKRYANKVPCEHHVTGLYRTILKHSDGSIIWRSNSKGNPQGVLVTEVPLQFTWKSTSSPFTFRAPSLFHDQLAGLTSSISMFKDYIFRIQKAERMINNLVNFTAEFGTDPEAIRQALAGVGDTVGTVIKDTGSAIGNIFYKVETGAADALSTILKGPIQAILNIIVVLAIILLILFLIWKFIIPHVKTEPIRRFWRRHPHAWYQRFLRINRPGYRQEPNPLERETGAENIEMQEINAGSTSQETRQETQEANIGAFFENTRNSKTTKEPQSLGHHNEVFKIELKPAKIADRRVFFRFKCLNSVVLALLDTGSSLTLMSIRQFKLLQKEAPESEKPVLKEVPKNMKAKSATGHELKLVGTVTLDLNFGVAVKNVTFTVVEHLQVYQCILGMDFISKLDTITLKPMEREIWVNNQKFSTKQPESANARLLKQTNIAPGTAKVIDLVLEEKTKELFENKTVVFTPRNEIHGPQGLCIDHSVHEIMGNSLTLMVYNYSSNTIKLKNRHLIGQVHVIDPSELKEVSAMSVDETMERKEPLKPEEMNFKIGTSLTEEEKSKFYALIQKYSSVFAKSEDDLGKVTIMKHHIKTFGPPTHCKPYPLPHSQRAKIEEHVKRMEKLGIVQKSNSPYAAPILIVPKKDGTDRFVTDFRKLNQQTQRENYPLPRIEDLIYMASNAKYYSSLDLLSGFWQLELDEASKPKTAFIGHYIGLYEYNRLPMGLKNSASSFQRLLEIVLRGMLYKSALCYVDDILILSKSFSEHLGHLEQLFQRLASANLKIKIRKCEFFSPEITFLGHVLTLNGLKINQRNTEKILQLPNPTSVKQTRSLLGLFSYYRRFIPSFATIAAPLHNLLKAETAFEWTKECTQAVQTLKEKMANPPVLKFPDFSKKFLLQTDSSGTGFGVVLAQYDGDVETRIHERPIAYASKTLSAAQRKMPAIYLEANAVAFGFKVFRAFLLGHFTEVQVDHAPLKWLLTTSQPSGKLMKVALKLSEFDFEVKYKPGIDNIVPDALSRYPESCLVMHTETEKLDMQNPIAQAQIADEQLEPIIKFLQEETLPREEQLARKIVLLSNYYVILDGLLFHLDPKQHNIEQLAVPKTMVLEILQTNHDLAFAGHFGVRRVYDKIRRSYFWKNMYRDVKHYVKSCETCQLNKPKHKVTRMELQPIKVSSGIFTKWGIDIVGEIRPPSMPDGFRYVLCVTDYLSRWAESFPMRDMKAATVARIFVERIVCVYGSPIEVVSDRGSQFLSDVMTEACKLLGITQRFTTAFRPQTNGCVESFNGILTKALGRFVTTNNSLEWPMYIPYLLMAYRTSIQESIQDCPYYIVFGTDCRTFMPENMPTTKYIIDLGDYKSQLRLCLNAARTQAVELLTQAQARQKVQYDRNMKPNSFQEGDLVLLYNPVLERNVSPKFHNYWIGVFRIIEIRQKYNAVIRKLGDPETKTQLVHFDRLKHFFARKAVEPELSNTARNVIQKPSTQLEAAPQKDMYTSKRSPNPTQRYDLRSRKNPA